MASPARIQASPRDISEFPRDTIFEVLQRDRRLRILQALHEFPAGMANDEVLKLALKSFGHAISSDLVRTEIGWLEEQGLVTVSRERNLQIATLSERGRDVTTGVSTQPGVALP